MEFPKHENDFGNQGGDKGLSGMTIKSIVYWQKLESKAADYQPISLHFIIKINL